MLPRSTSVLAVLAIVGAAATARAELARVWAVSDGTKVSSAATAHPLAAGNAVFDAETGAVRLFGLRNETVAFQVVVEGGSAATREVRLHVPGVGPVRNGPAASDDPDRYYVDRHVEVFEEPMLPLEERSRSLTWAPGTAAEPAIPLGPVPDPLVPHRAPVTVPPGENRVFWIDLWIPRDAAAGVHRGALLVEADGVTTRLAIELEIGDAALPEAPAARTMLYFSGAESPDEGPYVLPRYLADPASASAEELAALRRRHYHLARRHRVTLFAGNATEPDAEVEDLVSGALYTRAQGYDGPGAGLGDDVLVFHAYGGRLRPEEAARWTDWLAERGADLDHFLYVQDEPKLTPENIAAINAAAAEAEPVPSFVTTDYDPRFVIDIFAALAESYDLAAAEEGRAAGKRVWIYNGVRPHSGSFAIDDVAISPRVNPWIQARHGIPRWFYWEATYYLDFQGDRGQIDVWQTPLHFTNRHGDRVNGDGLLFYPGRDRLFPGSDQGIDRPLPSVRLKNWRRGIEDVAYLELARAAGHGAVADELLRTLLPRALSEARPGDPVAWPEDGERWLRARRVLFDAVTGAAIDRSAIAELARPAEPWRTRVQRGARRLLAPLIGSPRRRAVTGAAVAAVALVVIVAWRRRRRRR